MNDKTLRVLEYNKIMAMLAEFCVSPTAKRRALALKPATELAEVTGQLLETTETVKLLLKNSVHIGKINDILSSVKIAQIGSVLQNKALLEVADTLRTARLLKMHIEKQPSDILALPVLLSYTAQMQFFKTVEQEIERCILTETEIADNASSKLRQLRKAIDNKNEQIRTRLERIISSVSMQKYLQDALVTIRQDRFVIPIKSEHKSHIKGLVHDQSASGATSYIEPIEIVNLNNELRELAIEERREIERILLELSSYIGESADAIKATYQALIHLDFVFAKAKLSLTFKGVEPTISKDQFIRIKNGKHPLIAKDEVVPTNFYMGKDFKSLLITGPNTGGKTVTLKTVGLFCLLFQSGLHIPADYGTTLPIFTRIYADIGDEQSIEQSLSTFSSHMKNIVDILDHVTDKSLVLFDELGAGTDPTEGAALAIAILKHVYKKGALSVATTHYSELKQFAIVNQGFDNASVEFNISTLSPTYKLLIGVPGKSNAFEISKKLGLKQHIIDSASHFVDNDNIEFEEILNSIENNRKQSEQAHDEALHLKLDAQKLFERAKDADDKIKMQRDKIVKASKDEAKQLLKRAKEEADQLVKELRGMKQAAGIDTKRLEKIRRDLKDKYDALNTGVSLGDDNGGAIPQNLKLGQEVYVTTIGQTGAVVSQPNHKGQLQVQMGIIKMDVNIRDLRMLTQSSKPPKITKQASRRDVSGFKVSREVDLRGQNLEEAMLNLDKYLDDATLSGHTEVTIIHGVGTGVLKKGLSDFMRRHPHVKAQRLGVFGEGGAGVTIVTLK